MSNDAQRMNDAQKPEVPPAPDYARRIAGEVYWFGVENGTGMLGALAEAARQGYELGLGAALSR